MKMSVNRSCLAVFHTGKQLPGRGLSPRTMLPDRKASSGSLTVPGSAAKVGLEHPLSRSRRLLLAQFAQTHALLLHEGLLNRLVDKVEDCPPGFDGVLVQFSEDSRRGQDVGRQGAGFRHVFPD